MKIATAIGALVVIALLLVAVGLNRPQPPIPAPPDADWKAYQSRFITPEGRVIDVDNNNVSHSEGQGFGMILAEAHGDRAVFDRLLAWSDANLRRPDGLYAWRFLGNVSAADAVPDKNNASDGDILICWALLRAADRWNDLTYRNRALSLADVIRTRLIVTSKSEQTLLKPGIDGFFDQEKLVVNLSYWVFPALVEIGQATGDAHWRRLIDSGTKLLGEARFGSWQLPPDWLDLQGGALKPAEGFPSRFSFDAVRIPLYLAWAGLGSPDTFQAFANFWTQSHPSVIPAWVDLSDGALAPYPISQGVEAIRDIAVARTRSGAISRIDLGLLRADQGYYAASLFLLAKLAVREAGSAS